MYEEGKHILRFTADWCAPCRVYEPIFTRVTNAIDNVTAHVIDVSEDTELAKEHGVSSIPTTIVIVDGEEVDRQQGVVNQKDLRDMLSDD